MDYLQYANGACICSSVGYNYRMNLGSLTTSFRKDRFEACKKFYLEIARRLKQLEYEEDVFLRLKRMFFIYVKMCVVQETKKVSKKSQKECVQSIKKICEDSVVRTVISEYPVNQLGYKQQLFLRLIEVKAACLLYIMAEAKVIK